MARPSKLEPRDVDAWLHAHPSWARQGDDAVARPFSFANFADAVAFTVRLGFVAEKRDHHPEVLVTWGRARVLWTTHDAAGITSLDLALAEATDALYGGSGTDVPG
jgi:4a-hydroxytetrahydrobiopterin dehydratase